VFVGSTVVLVLPAKTKQVVGVRRTPFFDDAHFSYSLSFFLVIYIRKEYGSDQSIKIHRVLLESEMVISGTPVPILFLLRAGEVR
jgi:hypothetical protein